MRVVVAVCCSVASAADRNLTLVADNYTLGRVSLVDLLDAQTTALNARLAEGWSLCGSPFAGAGEVFQAVVRTIPDDKRLRRASTDTSSD